MSAATDLGSTGRASAAPGACCLTPLVSCIAVAAALLSAASHQLIAQQAARAIQWDGSSIVTKIRPEDTSIEVKKVTESPLYVLRNAPKSVNEEVKHFGEGVHAVVLGQLVDVSPSLVDDDSWLETQGRLRPSRVLRFRPDGPTKLDVRLEFPITYDGGEIRIGATLVKFGRYPVLQPKRQYLFGVVIDPVRDLAEISFIFAVDSDGLVTPEVVWSDESSRPPSTFYGQQVTRLEREFGKLP